MFFLSVQLCGYSVQLCETINYAEEHGEYTEEQRVFGQPLK